MIKFLKMENNKNIIKFSIICPVFNTEKYINDCIQSVLKQSYKNWELILVDDGSTDNSSQICDFFCEKYPKQIKIIHKKNEGLYLARIDGLYFSSGNYILNLDSDDTFENNCLFSLCQTISQHDPDIIYFIAKHGKEIYGKLPFKIKNIANTNFYKKILLTTDYLNSVCKQCVKKQIINLKQLKIFKTNSLMAEDKIFSIIIIDNAKKIFYFRKILYNYRVNFNSITGSTPSLENINNKYNKNLYSILIKFQKKWKFYNISQDIFDYILNAQIQLFHSIFTFNTINKSIKIIKKLYSERIVKIENANLFKKSKVFYFSKLLFKNNILYLYLYGFAYRFYRLIKFK